MVIALVVGVLAGTWLAEYARRQPLRRGRPLPERRAAVGAVDPGRPVRLRAAGRAVPRLLRLRRRRGPGPARRAGDHPHHRGRAASCSRRPCAKPAWRWARRSGLVIRTILWRSARSGILTGGLLAFARISGETAPLLFTALNNQFFSWNLTKPMANLPVVIFNFALSAYDDWRRLAWAGALLIAGAVLGRHHHRPHRRPGATPLMNTLNPAEDASRPASPTWIAPDR